MFLDDTGIKETASVSVLPKHLRFNNLEFNS